MSYQTRVREQVRPGKPHFRLRGGRAVMQAAIPKWRGHGYVYADAMSYLTNPRDWSHALSQFREMYKRAGLGK